MNRGAWWAPVYGVTKSQARLKRLSTQSDCFFSHLVTFGGIHHLKITPVNGGPGVSFSQVLNSQKSVEKRRTKD